MNIAIVGAGIVGITTAFELAVDGHEVTVFERHGAAAEEASFATAGLLSSGWLLPWAATGLSDRHLRQQLRRQRHVRLVWPPSWGDLTWLRAARRACEPAAFAAQRALMQPLAAYSRERLQELTRTLQLRHDGSTGILVLLRSEREVERALASLPALQAVDIRCMGLTPNEAKTVEPGLHIQGRLAGAIHLPDDSVANCRQFTLLLKKEAQTRGVRFEFNQSVMPLDRREPTELRVVAPGEPPQAHRFDAVVVCAGAASASLLRPAGLALPLAPVRGYAISTAIGEALNAPRSAVIDAHHRVTISRLGQRVRVTGGAELGGDPRRLHQATLKTLYEVLHDWFPAGAQWASTGATVQEWQGASPTLPDALPVLGASDLPGVWLNLGHGHHGWTLACGSARALADQVSGRPTAIDITGLGAQRLRA